MQYFVQHIPDINLVQKFYIFFFNKEDHIHSNVKVLLMSVHYKYYYLNFPVTKFLSDINLDRRVNRM